MLGPGNINTLISTSNLARTLLHLGEHAKAAAFLRTTIAVRTRTLGTDGMDTLFIESHLAETNALSRCTLEKQRRACDQDHRDTLERHVRKLGDLARTARQARRGHATAEIEREVVLSTTRLFGAEHQQATVPAANPEETLFSCS